MKSYKISWPGFDDEPMEEIMTEEQILSHYFKRWCNGMKNVNKEHLISKERCIEDFITVHWAEEVK